MKKEKKTEIIGVPMETALKKKIRDEADRKYTTVAGIIRTAIWQYFNREKSNPN